MACRIEEQSRIRAGLHIGKNGGADNIGFDGIYQDNSSQSEFNNTGTITLDNIFNKAIYVDAGTFNNQSLIKIGQFGNINAEAIDYDGTFLNAPCDALIHIFSDNIISGSGTFTNDGNIIENATNNSSIDTNNGLVQNLNGGNFSITNNNGVLTTKAGDFIWRGCTDQNWDIASNWHSGTVPTANDNVIIVNVVNDPVISGTTSAFAKSVTVETDAQLTINSGGSLAIDNSSSGGLEIEGNVLNEGTIDIGQNGGNVKFNGLRISGGYLSNGTNGKININDVVNGTGLNLVNGKLDNLGHYQSRSKRKHQRHWRLWTVDSRYT